MGLKDFISRFREYPALSASLEASQDALRQARQALEKTGQECERLSGDYGEAQRRLRFSEKKREALQSTLETFCPKLASLEGMLRFYDALSLSPNLDPQVFILYRTAKKMTGIDLHSYFSYEDNRGMFEAMDGRQLLHWLTAARFDAVDWEIVTGTDRKSVV